MAQAKQPSNNIMQQLTADKVRTEKLLQQHRARLKELEGLDGMIWGREIARTTRAINRAQARMDELSRLFSNISSK